jgi:hypothetical protein
MLTIDTLAGHDITKWKMVLTQSYDQVIIKLLMDRERTEFQKRYSQVIQKQDGRN